MEGDKWNFPPKISCSIETSSSKVWTFFTSQPSKMFMNWNECNLPHLGDIQILNLLANCCSSQILKHPFFRRFPIHKQSLMVKSATEASRICPRTSVSQPERATTLQDVEARENKKYSVNLTLVLTSWATHFQTQNPYFASVKHGGSISGLTPISHGLTHPSARVQYSKRPPNYSRSSQGRNTRDRDSGGGCLLKIGDRKSVWWMISLKYLEDGWWGTKKSGWFSRKSDSNGWF